MKLWSDSFADGATIPDTYGFCRPDPASHVALSDNKNPHFAWSDVPEGTRSFALVCHDPDVPSVGDDVNQEDRTVSNDLPRVDFFHWLLFDLAADLRALQEGSHSQGVTPRGKPGPGAPQGARHGVNDYTGWFSADPDMSGDYFGYDGPCPPWNDERLHHYVFTLYALDVATLPLSGRVEGGALRAALAGHTLAQASWTGTFTLNPALRG